MIFQISGKKRIKKKTGQASCFRIEHVGEWYSFLGKIVAQQSVINPRFLCPCAFEGIEILVFKRWLILRILYSTLRDEFKHLVHSLVDIFLRSVCLELSLVPFLNLFVAGIFRVT